MFFLPFRQKIFLTTPGETMRRQTSLENTIVQEKVESNRTKGRPDMRWTEYGVDNRIFCWS